MKKILVGTICLFLVIGAIFAISDISCKKNTYAIKINFENVQGLETGSPVRYRGVEVGEISSIGMSQTNVAVVARIGEDVLIPKNSKFMISKLGMLGESYIEIVPSDNKEYIGQGAVVDGLTPDTTTFEDIFSRIISNEKQIQQINKKLDRIILLLEKK